MEAITVLFLIFLVRFFETYFFLRKISKLCNKYDWKYVDKHDYLLPIIMNDKEYYKNQSWSAYNFLYLDGPDPIKMYFSFKSLNIHNIYNKDIINKIENEII